MSHIVCVLRCQDIQQLSLVSHLVSYVCIDIEGQIVTCFICLPYVYTFIKSFDIWVTYSVICFGQYVLYVICLICSVICVICLSCVSQKIAIFWKIFEFSNCTYFICFCHMSYLFYMFFICMLICLSYVACLVVDISMNVLPISRNGKFIRKCVYLLQFK